MTYQTYANRVASAKTTLVHIEGKELVKVFTTVGTSHTRNPGQFVTAVTINGSDGTFTYDPMTDLLTITFTGDISLQEVILTYRFFFSDRPSTTSFDLSDAGFVVEYEPRVKSIPGFSTELSFAKSNKTIIGNGNLILDNSDDYFTNLFKTVRFDNKPFTAYSWDHTQMPTDNKVIFNGVLHRASLSGTNITFAVKDSIFNLNSEIPLIQFTSDEVVAKNLSRFKKRIFGRVNGMSVQSISQIGDGYPLTGTLNASAGQKVLKGTDTLFLNELAPRDKIIIGSLSLTVRQIINNTTVELTNNLSGGIADQTAIVKPTKPWFNTNRVYSVASHTLKRFETTLLNFDDRRRLRVTSTVGFEAGDNLVVNNEFYLIERITNFPSGPVIVIERTLSSNNLPAVNDLIFTREVPIVKLRGEQIIDNDYVITNPDNGESSIQLSTTAEQNLAAEGVFGSDVTAVSESNYFILGSPTIQTVTVTTGTDYRGTHLRLAKDDDTSTTSGDFVWFGFVESVIREFSTTAAALVNFSQGAIYFNTTEEEYIGIKSAGTGPRTLDTDHIVLGTLPIRLQISDANNNFTSVTNLLLEQLALNRTIQILAPLLTGWKFITNQGIALVGNTLVAGVTNGPAFTSTVVTGAVSDLDISLSENLGPRDLIRIEGQLTPFQVIQAESKFVQVTGLVAEDLTGTCFFKNPNYVTDTSLTTVAAFGQTEDGTALGTWIKTPTNAVKKVLIDNGLADLIDDTSFNSTDILANFTGGIYVPYKLGAKAPTVLDFVNKCTISTLGAIGLNDDFKIKFQLLNGATPSDLSTIRLIRNDELTAQAATTIKPSSLFKYTIANIEGSYNFGEDDPTSDFLRISDPTIRRLTDLDTTESVNIYMPKLNDTRGILSRYINYGQRFNQIFNLSGSLSFADIEIGQLVLLNIQEAGNDPVLGMVTYFSRNGSQIALRVEDMGGLFIKSATWAANNAATFANATQQERTLNTYFTAENGLINNDESTIGNNVFI